MTADYQKFKQYHFRESPLLLGNVWNVQSAWVCQELGFDAIGTSSAAIAQTLGYEDGEQLPFEIYLLFIERILQTVNIPLSVDFEAGYGNNPEKILENILKLHALGVAGVNLEDSRVINGQRLLQSSFEFSKVLNFLSSNLQKLNVNIFLNVRSDVFLLGLPQALEEAKNRIRPYEEAGAEGIYLPFITKQEDIMEITKFTALPLNVMCMPELADFKKLQDWGVKRISMGNFVNQKVYDYMNDLLSRIIEDQRFKVLF